MFTFVFRYRDLVADTIKEHRDIIATRDACWWGWWKRPREDARRDVWDSLATSIREQSSVTVALFDSGATDESRAVRLATVTQIVKPHENEGVSPSDLPVVAVPESERELVPGYYRDSPFSRGWLKITEISEPISFFEAYSYAAAPPLPGIAQNLLKALEGKQVVDIEEMAGMDTTIWSVRRADSSDPKDRWVVGSVRVSSPMSSAPVAVDHSVILHLSDPHFARGSHRQVHTWRYHDESGSSNTLVEAIVRALKGRRVGMVVITGDITFVASPDEFSIARKSILELLGALNLDVDRLVIVPGNHDIAWSERPPDGAYKHEHIVTSAPEKAVSAYRDFFVSLMRLEPSRNLSVARRYVLPHGIVLEVGGANSSSLEQGKDYYAGMGRLPETAIDEIAECFGWKQDAPRATLRVVAMHHHVTLVEDLENAHEYAKGFGMAIDAKKTLREVAEYGVQLILHGHRHRSFVWREGVYHLSDLAHEKYALGHVNILGGGSVGSSDLPQTAGNHFHVIEVAPDEIVVDVFRSDNRGPFSRRLRWSTDVTLEGGQLRLSDWKKLETCPS